MSLRASTIGFACCLVAGLLSLFVFGRQEIKTQIFIGLSLSVLFNIGYAVGVREERRRLLERVRRAVGGASDGTVKRVLDALREAR